jgi:hypothetical protein
MTPPNTLLRVAKFIASGEQEILSKGFAFPAPGPATAVTFARL